MPIVAAIAVPHPPLILPEVGRGGEREIQPTTDAYKRAVRFLADQKPETVVIFSPHASLYADYISISPGAGGQGDFAQFGAPQVVLHADYDEALVAAICAEAEKRGVPAGTRGKRHGPLDHGTTIPLYFLNEVYSGYKVVRIGLSGLSPAEHYRLGECVAAAAGEKRVALIGSGDLSHRLKESGPYGFRPEGPQLDKEITAGLAEGDFGRLMRIDPGLADRGAECGLRSFIMMGGGLDGRAVEAELLAYQDVTGVGYAVATFLPGSPEESRRFLEQYKQEQVDKVTRSKQKGDAYVALARQSLEHYIKTGKRLPLPGNLPAEMTTRRAGVFVSLHKDGSLRGCIGTISPVAGSVAEEILRNAVSAATEDPRFLPVREDELDTLEVGVDVLGYTEPIQSLDELDVQKYGVVVSTKGRRGLLLPALDGIDTPEEQVRIARGKAGIGPEEPVYLERFEVVRHE